MQADYSLDPAITPEPARPYLRNGPLDRRQHIARAAVATAPQLVSALPAAPARHGGGEVEVEGPVDAAQILDCAGFISARFCAACVIRLHFDTGQEHENQQATYAAQILSTAGYQVDLDPNLLPAAGHGAPVNGWPPRAPTSPPYLAPNSKQQPRR
ncbi:hypothetical protein [Streptomyces sp. NPDC017988]|uniref:hypothetical protein n=1 Tax=Streptomyces sp. NPDC017988 TaxID=3365025 RepID=UPI0037A9BF52